MVSERSQSIMVGKARLWERVCKRYLHHPAAGGSITCKGLPGHLLHQPSTTLERLHSLQQITTDWGPKLGSYYPMRGHWRFRFKSVWLQTRSTKICAKWNFKRSALCKHVILHFTVQASVKYMTMITVLGRTEVEKEEGGQMGQGVFHQCLCKQSVKSQWWQWQWSRWSRCERWYFSHLRRTNWQVGEAGEAGHIPDVVGFLLLPQT